MADLLFVPLVTFILLWCSSDVSSQGNYTNSTTNGTTMTTVSVTPETTSDVPSPKYFNCSLNWQKFGNEFCYKFFDNETTYDDAFVRCKEIGANLTSISTLSQLHFITSYVDISKSKSYWIGLSDRKRRGNLYWEDGTPVTLINWSSQTHYAYPTSHNTCAYLEGVDKSEYGKWIPANCNEMHGYVCRRPTQHVSTPPLPPPGCPANLTAWRWGCYWLLDKPMNWTEANSVCRSKQGLLVWLENRAELEFLKSLISKSEEWRWIDLNRQNVLGSFMWSVRLDKLLVSLSDLHLSASTALSKGKCVVGGLSKDYVTFEVSNCSKKIAAVCKQARQGFTAPPSNPILKCPYSGWSTLYGSSTKKCYKIFRIKESWQMAKKTCEAYGGELIKIPNSQINTKVINFINKYNRYWIGLNFIDVINEGKWTDGSSVTYTRWMRSRRTSNANKRCVYVYRSWSYSEKGWNNDTCGRRNGFICTVDKGPTMLPAPTAVPVPQLQNCSDEGPGWYSRNGFCYYLNSQVSDKRTWTEARKYCKDHGGDLVSIHSHLEMDFIIQMMYSVSILDSYFIWIGFNSMHMFEDYRWSDGSAVNYIHWKKGDPVNSYYQEKCAAIQKSTGEWSDFHCQLKKNYICKKVEQTSSMTYPTPPPPFPGYCPVGWKEFNDRCYSLSMEMRSWSSALSYCRRLGPGHNLATISSNDLQRFLMIYIGEHHVTPWIGLNDRISEGTFRWSDNSPRNYTAWAKNQPSRSGDCVMMKNDILNGGKWVVVSCYRSLPHICQRYKNPMLSKPGEVSKKCEGHKEFDKYRNKCFKAMDETDRTWIEADKNCNKLGGNLASIQNIYEQAFVTNLMKSKNKTFWIGLRIKENEQKFNWINKWPVEFTYWAGSIPRGNKSRCSFMTNSGKWKVEDCLQKRPYICEISNNPLPSIGQIRGFCPSLDWLDIGNRYCYMLLTSGKKWSDASFSCIQKGGILASFHSVADIEHVLRRFGRQHQVSKKVWIGLYMTISGVKWLDESPVDLDNWQSDSISGDCIYLNITSKKWKSSTCGLYLPYLCMTNKNITYDPSTAIKQLKHVTNEEKSSSLTSGQGAIIGIACAVIICLVAAAVFYYRRRKLQGQSEATRTFTFDNEMYESN